MNSYGTEGDYWDAELANAQCLLENGGGIGALQSDAMLYCGYGGYFCVHQIIANGKPTNAIVFVTTANTIEVVTSFQDDPTIKKFPGHPAWYFDTK